MKKAIPLFPQPNIKKAAEFYRVVRDDFEFHVWKCADKKIADNTENTINGFEVANRVGMKSVAIAMVNLIETNLKLDSLIDPQIDFLCLNPQEVLGGYVPV